MQRLAAQQPPRRQPHAGKHAMALQRLDGIVRARRVKPATARRTEYQRQQRRDAELVHPHRGNHRQAWNPPDTPPLLEDGASRSPSGFTAGLTVRRQFCGGFFENVCRDRQSRHRAGSDEPRSPNRCRAGSRADGGERVRVGHVYSGCAPRHRRRRAKPQHRAGQAGCPHDCAPRAKTIQRRNAGRSRGRHQNRRCAVRAAPVEDEGGAAGRQTTVRRLRPLRRREASTLRPPRVAIRARNPILRTRFFLLGR